METRNRVGLSFYVKRTKPLKNGEVPIYVKISVNGIVDELATLKSIPLEKWSIQKNGAIGNTKEARELNDSLISIRNQLLENARILKENGEEITATSIKESYLGINKEEKKVIELFKEHNTTLRLLAEKSEEYSTATVKRYEACLNHLKNFIKLKFRKDDMFLNSITQEFITGFELYLKIDKNCGHNTTIKYIKNFKKIIRNAVNNGWIKKDPFVNIKLKSKKVDKEFLTENELFLLINKKFSIERLEQVKDVFLFGCFTGLAYSDLKELTLDNVVLDEKGKLWVHTHRKKTDIASHIPLLLTPKMIIEKYKNNPYCQLNNKLLPVYSNQKMNGYLKEISTICGIQKKLTSHIARYTFATTVTLNNDIPIESVSKMLGHSSIKMTQHYATLLDKKVGQDMEKIKDKFTQNPLSGFIQNICLN